MSGAAWEAGFRNAGIVTPGVFSAFALLILCFHFLLQEPWLIAVRNGVGVGWISSFLCFIVIHLWGRLTRGAVLLDCGYRPRQWIFFLNAMLLPVIIFANSHLLGNISITAKFAFAVPLSAFYLIMGLGRMKLCTHGIWIYQELIKWERIKSYQWQENSLLVDYHSKGPIPAKGVLSFPADCKWSVDLILREHLSLTDE